jgi:hypothetical protein
LLFIVFFFGIICSTRKISLIFLKIICGIKVYWWDLETLSRGFNVVIGSKKLFLVFAFLYAMLSMHRDSSKNL